VGPRVIDGIAALDRMPVYGREGCLLPLGPAAQHTGELKSNGPTELLVFGRPGSAMELPGLTLVVDAADGTTRLRGLPPDVRVTAWGSIRVERRRDEALFRGAE
jgi:hypothetical protein